MRSQVLALVLTVIGTAAQACELALVEHRTDRDLTTIAISPDAPRFQVRFTHSVLSTEVIDFYEWQRTANGWKVFLTAEEFEGEGYGLAHGAQAGEQFIRVHDRPGGAWRLITHRLVDPLVIRPLPEQHMRVVIAPDTEIKLANLGSPQSVLVRLQDCP